MTGAPIYPGTYGDPNIDGFTNGIFNDKEPLKVGQFRDRFGDNGTGKYFSPEGSSFGSRGLPPFMLDKPHQHYKVLKEFRCKTGEIAPAFGQEGKGIQFFTDYQITDPYGNLFDATVKNLVKYDYLELLK